MGRQKKTEKSERSRSSRPLITQEKWLDDCNRETGLDDSALTRAGWQVLMDLVEGLDPLDRLQLVNWLAEGKVGDMPAIERLCCGPENLSRICELIRDGKVRLPEEEPTNPEV